MNNKLSTLALAVVSCTALAATEDTDDTIQKGGAGAYTLQESDAQEYIQKKESKARGEIYGFAMIDMGYNGGSTNKDWFDVVRPTQMPGNNSQLRCDGVNPDGTPNGDCNDYTTEGSTYASVRQTRFGVKGWVPTPGGKEIHTIFEFEMFGTGADAGQTTIRLRHAYGEMGAFGGGQYWSPFMDINVFPNSVEYWGPSGMAFFRNIQFRWMPIRGDSSNLTFALEKPGAGRDTATDEVEENLGGRQVRGRYPVPDLSAAYSFGSSWGYVRAAGILRYISWEDDAPVAGDDLSGNTVGYGVNLSTNLKFGPGDSVLKLALVGGQGIQNYMNEATGDVGFEDGDIETIPMWGLTAFYDLWWSDRFSSTIGYSSLNIDNRNQDSPSNFKKGEYALLNLLYYPADNVMFGGELQYGKRENNDDGWDYDLWRVQFSARYNFSFGLGG